MPTPPKIKDEDTTYNLFKDERRSVDRVEIKIDKLIDITKTQIEDIKGVKEELSELKEEVASISSEFKLHAFEDASRFREWETKFSKEIEPILKHVNERIALGGWVKSNQKLIIFFVLSILAAMGIVKGKDLVSFATADKMEVPAQIEQKEPEEPKTLLHNNIEKAFEQSKKEK